MNDATEEVRDAMCVIKKAMYLDPYFACSWNENIACHFIAEGMDPEAAHDAARKFLKTHFKINTIVLRY